MTPSPTQYSAEIELELEVKREKSSIGVEPFICNDKTMFNRLESSIFLNMAQSILTNPII